MKTDFTLDTVGRFCPVPIIETSVKMKEMKIGDTLTVISDDAGIESDMPNWCKMTGNEFLGHSVEDGIHQVFIRKTSE
jgi:tRNA 2-thiouridine synthesizing protein A